MLRLAYFSPVPSQRTGIADYSADLLPQLASLADVTLFSDSTSQHTESTLGDITVRHPREFQESRWNYDMALYQMGNSLHHTGIYATAIRNPGIVVLHDYTLHHFVASVTAGKGDFPKYLREMTLEQGMEGARRAWQIKNGAPTPLYDIPLTAGLIGRSVGILVHSEYARQLVSQRHPRSRVAQVSQPIPLPPLLDKSYLRTKLDIPREAFVVITCGINTPEKRIDVVSDTLDAFRELHPDTIWLKSGGKAAEAAPESATDSLRDWVIDVGYIDSLQKLSDYLMASDVCINLRHPTSGETSASCLRALASGTPVVVSDEGWYRELPFDCCPRVVHNGTETVQLEAILDSWHSDRALHLAASRSARQHMADNFQPRNTASAYIEFIESVLRYEV